MLKSGQSKQKQLAFVLMLYLVLFLFLKYLLQLSPGIFIADLLEITHGKAKAVGLLAAVYLYAYLILQIPAGIIVDRYKLSNVILSAVIICLTGTILFACTKNFYLLIISRILMGIGSAFGTVCYMRAAALYFSDKGFARLSGFFGTACMGGAGATVLIFGYIYTRFGIDGTSLAIILFTGFLSILGLIFCFLEPHMQQKNNLNCSNKVPAIQTIKNILLNKSNILLLLYNGLAFAPISVFGGLWGKSFLQNIHNLSLDQSTTAISVMFFSFAIGGPVLTSLFVGQKKQRNIMAAGIFVSLVFFISFVYLPHGALNYGTILGLMAVIGFFTSSFVASYAIAKSYNEINVIATVIAIVNMGDPIFAGLAEPIMGVFMDAAGGNLGIRTYQIGFMVLVLYWISAVICALCLPMQKESTVQDKATSFAR